MELDLPLVSRLEAVDAQHPATVALATGPLVLMALRSHAQEPAPESPQEPFTRAVLLSAKPGIDSEPPVNGWDWRRYAAAETIPGYSG